MYYLLTLNFQIVPTDDSIMSAPQNPLYYNGLPQYQPVIFPSLDSDKTCENGFPGYEGTLSFGISWKWINPKKYGGLEKQVTL